MLTVATSADSPAEVSDDAELQTPTAADAIDFTRSPLTLGFFGDSITHSGKYHQQVQLFLLTRYPGQDIWTVNIGYSGQTSWGVLRGGFLDKDVEPAEPDVLFLHFGMNDVNRNQYKGLKNPPSDQSRESRRGDYVKAMNSLVDQALERDLQVVILSPTIYEDEHTRHANHGQSPHLNAELKYFGDLGKKIADAKDAVSFIDLHTLMNEINQQMLAKDKKNTLIGDRVHPRRGGEEVMTYIILKNLGVRPSVYDIVILDDGKVQKSEGASVSNLQISDSGASFTLAETALPFPTRQVSGHFSRVPLDETLNTMRLAVEGLAAGQYALSIDGQAVGSYSHEQFAQGIDLSDVKETPQYQKSLELLEQMKLKQELELAVANMRALRNYLGGMKTESGEPLELAWDKLDPAEVLKAVERKRKELEAAGKIRGWTSYVFNQGRDGFNQYHEIMQGLADLREQWAALPSDMTHDYEIEPAN
jgi:lysophospholipase L1-like esterase